MKIIKKLIIIFSMIISSVIVIYHVSIVTMAEEDPIKIITDDDLNGNRSTSIYITMDRVGSSTTVNCYLNYQGSYVASYARFGTITVKSSNLIENITYGTIYGNYDRLYFTPAGTSVSKYIGSVSIPVGITSAYISCGTIIIGFQYDELSFSLTTNYVSIY